MASPMTCRVSSLNSSSRCTISPVPLYHTDIQRHCTGVRRWPAADQPHAQLPRPQLLQGDASCVETSREALLTAAVIAPAANVEETVVLL